MDQRKLSDLRSIATPLGYADINVSRSSIALSWSESVTVKLGNKGSLKALF